MKQFVEDKQFQVVSMKNFTQNYYR